MIRLTPRSTRTDTLLPYTTRCRSQGFFSIAASTCTESVTGLSEAAWLAGEDCDDVALSPLPPQAASSSAGASTSIAYDAARGVDRSEAHPSELQSLMRISYAVFCLKKQNQCSA